MTATARPLLVVDGANVVGSVPDGWWRDRAGAAARLRDELAVIAGSGLPAAIVRALGEPVAGDPAWDRPPEVVLVVEGAARGLASTPQVEVVSAEDSGDDEIVAVVRERGLGRVCAVATADRGLIERVTALGAVIVGPRAVRAGRFRDR